MSTPAQSSKLSQKVPAHPTSEVPVAEPVVAGSTTTSSSETVFQSIRWKTDVAPHFRTGVLLTGAFTVAWGWCLVLYALSHANAGENPLRQQIGFAHATAPSSIIVLLLEYLLVCAGVAYLSDFFSKLPHAWSGKPAVTAIEFVPSPFFAGKLMGYLAQFGALSKIDRALLNLAATAGAAALSFALPPDLGDRFHPTLRRLSPIVQNTLGFGLGIAWNVLLAQVLLPKSSEDDNDGNSSHRTSLLSFVAHIGYLAVVSILTLRVTSLQQSYRRTANAQTESDQQQNPWPRFWEHQTGLLAFALSVVAAFALVDVGDRTLTSAWYGRIEAIVVLLGLSALSAALVASVDLDVLRERQQTSNVLALDESAGDNSTRPNCCTLLTLCLPCVWCCCPWVPVLVVLNHTDAGDTLKEDWYQLIAMVTGLAASIEASNLVVALTNAVASIFSCTASHCSSVLLFCFWQIAVACALTLALLPLLGRWTVAPEEQGSSSLSDQPPSKPTSRNTLDEKQPLLSA
jgi:hypothetical protein